MRGLVGAGVGLVVAWMAIVLIFHVMGGGIHLALIAGIVLILVGLVRRAAAGDGGPSGL
jgi:hypothetical protein